MRDCEVSNFAQTPLNPRVVIPEEANANSAAMSAWIDSNRDSKRRRRGRKTAYDL
jgi:DNA topoisomerase-3